MSDAATVAAQIAGLSRAELELLAAKILRKLARGVRPTFTESLALVHIAGRLERFARDEAQA